MIKSKVNKYYDELHELYATRDNLINKKIRLEGDIVPHHFEERKSILKKMRKLSRIVDITRVIF